MAHYASEQRARHADHLHARRGGRDRRRRISRTWPRPRGRLGPHRIEELAAACEALGVTDHRFLGGPGRWRDSGMMGTPTNDDPASFWQADLDEAARDLVAIIREVRPQVVITYDENGGYGHPDHIRAHQVAVAAFDAAGDAELRAGARRALGSRRSSTTRRFRVAAVHRRHAGAEGSRRRDAVRGR